MLFSAMPFSFINAGLKSNRIYSDSTLAASLGPFEIPRRNRVFSSLGTTIGQSFQRGSLAGQRLSRHKVLILKSAEPRQNTMTFNRPASRKESLNLRSRGRAGEGAVGGRGAAGARGGGIRARGSRLPEEGQDLALAPCRGGGEGAARHAPRGRRKSHCAAEGEGDGDDALPGGEELRYRDLGLVLCQRSSSAELVASSNPQ